MTLLAFLVALTVLCAFVGPICSAADRPSRSKYDRWGKK